MSKLFFLLLAFFFFAFALSSFSQQPFSNCTAAFLDNKMIVNEYSPEGKCTLPAAATGILTVCTAELSPDQSIAKDKIRFKIAIRDKNTGTLTMYAAKNYKKVDISKVLARCHKGDHIVLITLNDEYALPHNEILIQ